MENPQSEDIEPASSVPTLPTYFQATGVGSVTQQTKQFPTSVFNSGGLFGAHFPSQTSSVSIIGSSKMTLPSTSANFENTLKAIQDTDQGASEVKPTIKRSVSVDVSQLRTIVAFDLPEDCDKLELTKYFQSFGNVVKVYLNPKKHSANVQFDSHEAAAKAKKLGTKLRPNVELKILWKQTDKEKEKGSVAAKKIISVVSKQKLESASASVNENNVETDSKSKKNAKMINLSEGLPMQITIEELKVILTQPTRNAAERATLLDARDKYFRMLKEIKGKSSANSSSGTILIGTCMDMCPEKERYSREEKRRLAPYEQLATPDKDYKVNHQLAIKEYSRSSADQAEPLAHELRPLHVLQMTTDYLIINIFDRCDKPGEHLGDWFTFLWDRTRGIRKDITQQSLCDPGSVDLVEKCARFHIHCTARLCELEVQDFDQKINNENLTKCLQTLKHMYYDLSIKNVFCRNEAEFRAYDVLLHLNDGDILREVLQLEPEVRDSPQVRSALQFVTALNSGNYVLFFKLAKKNTDYLQCCLLQHYFQQVRTRALRVIVQAYGKNAQIPVASLMAWLGFENKEEATLFCQCHGLPVDNTKEIVHFERSSYIEEPEKFPSTRRSFLLIENKRLCSVSQIIANGPLPTDPTTDHKPQNSFDNNGYLLREAWLDNSFTDQKHVAAIHPSTTPRLAANVKQSSPLRRLPEITMQHQLPTYQATIASRPPVTSIISSTILESVWNQLLTSTVDEIARETLVSVLNQQIKIKKIAGHVFQIYMTEFMRETFSDVIKEVILEQKLVREREQRKLMLETKKQSYVNNVQNEIINDVVRQQLLAICAEEIKTATEIRSSIKKQKIANHFLESLLADTAVLESRAVASMIANEAIQKRETMVKTVQKQIFQQRCIRWIMKWRRFTAMRIRRRKENQTFPAGPSHLLLGQQVLSLKSKGETSSLKRKSVMENSVNVKRVNYLSDVQLNIQKLSSILGDKVVDLFSLLDEPLSYDQGKRKFLFWKLVFVAVNCSGIGDSLKKLFNFHAVEQCDNGWTFVGTRETGRPFTLCVRFTNDIRKLEDVLRGTDAVVVIYDPSTLKIENSLQFIKQLLSEQSEFTPMALATIVAKPHLEDAEYLTRILKSSCQITLDFDQRAPDTILKLTELMLALAGTYQNNAMRSSISTSTLLELIDNFISQKILAIIGLNLRQRLLCGLTHQAFSIQLDLFNHGIRFLIKRVLLDPRIRDVRWPSKELAEIEHLLLPPVNWNSTSYQHKLRSLLERYFLLPIWNGEEDDASSVDHSLQKYCAALAIPGTDSTTLYSRIQSILTNFQVQCEASSPSRACFLMYNIPWTEIFQACVDYRFQAFANDYNSKLRLGYFAETFDEFETSEIWKDASYASYCLHAGEGEPEDNLSDQPVDRFENNDLISKIEEIPEAIADLRDTMFCTSKQSQLEDQEFEEKLHKALTFQPMRSQPLKSTPKKLKLLPLGNLEDNFNLLERTLDRSRREDIHFESFLKRAMEE